jgi:hypothetical protein
VGRRVKTKAGFCKSVTGNICSTLILQQFAHHTACSDALAMANTSTSMFKEVIQSKYTEEDKQQ